MSTFVLVPGAGGAAWYWHRVVPLLEDAGHRVVAVDIREDDPALGLPEYADLVEAAADGATGVVLVGQSMGAFTVPVVANRRPVDTIVLTNPMVPLPRETPGAWWDATGHPEARIANDDAAGRATTFDEATHFLHDVPADVVAEGQEVQRGPADTPFGQPAEFDRGPLASRSMCCSVATTASSRSISPVASPASGSGSTRMSSTAATCSRWRTRTASPRS